MRARIPVSPSDRPSLSARGCRCGLVLALVSLAGSCGGGSTPTQPSGQPSPSPAFAITISATGASPRTLTVPVGSRVTIVNTDSRAHEMTSDPHPSHEDCPELNQIGFLSAGQQRESGNLVVPRTCGFHDHLNPGTQSLNGTIVIR